MNKHALTSKTEKKIEYNYRVLFIYFIIIIIINILVAFINTVLVSFCSHFDKRRKINR